MKNIILTLLFAFSILFASAQRRFKKGDYLKSSYIDHYIGTWEWTSGSDSFTIVFKKIKYHHKALQIDEDRLQGWFKYVKNGKSVENSIQNMGTENSSTAVGGETEKHKLLITFTDINTKKTNIVVMELDAGRSDKAVWHVDPAFPQGITNDPNGIPTGDSWVMYKIK